MSWAHAGLYEEARQSLQMQVPQADLNGVSVHGGIHLQTGQTAQSGTLLRGQASTGGACGAFDFRGSMKQTLEDVPGMLTALVMDIGQQIPLLATCEIWPTWCDNIKHWQALLSGLISAKYAQCQSIQNSMAYMGLRLRQGATSQCLEDAVERGEDLSTALKTCSSTLTSLRRPDGTQGGEVNLVRDTLSAAGASQETITVAGSLLGEVTMRVGNGKLTTQMQQRPGAYLGAFEAHRRAAAEALRTAVQEYQEMGTVSGETLRLASTPGQATPVVVIQALAAAKADPTTFESVVGKLSTRQALVQLTWECHSVEDELATAMESNAHLTDEARRALDQRVKAAQRSLAQLTQKVDAEEKLQPVFDDLLRQYTAMQNAAAQAGLTTPTLTLRSGTYGRQTPLGFVR